MRNALLSIVLVLAACRSTTTELVGGEIRNRSREPILDMRAAHEPTGRVITVNQILPGTSFLLGFQPRELKTRKVTLTWKTAGGSTCERTLQIAPPSEEMREGPCWLVYTIAGASVASYRWERPPPSYRNASSARP